jgi:hypothetical protein
MQVRDYCTIALPLAPDDRWPRGSGGTRLTLEKDADGSRGSQSVTGSAEFQLAVRCCRSAFEKASLDAPSSGFDWPRFLDLVRFHRIEGLAWQALSGASPKAPEPVMARLSDAAAAIAATNLRASLNSGRLLTLFRSAHLNILFLKGVTLGALAYGNPALKAAIDIDVLVDAADLRRAAAILREAGYELLMPVESGGDRTLLSWHGDWKESVWTKDCGLSQLDLHSAAADNPALIPSITASAPTQEVDIGNGISLPTLAREELVAYLGVHGASSAWFRLKWISDFAALIHGLGSSEIEKLYARSNELGAARAAGQAFLLADRLFGTLSGCSGLRAELLADRTIRWLVQIAQGLLERGPVEPTGSLLGTLPIHGAQFLLRSDLAFRLSEFRGQARRALWRARL